MVKKTGGVIFGEGKKIAWVIFRVG